MLPLGKRKGDNFLQPTVKSGALRRKKGKKKISHTDFNK